MVGGGEDDSKIVRSSFADIEKDIIIPNVSYPEFIFSCIRRNMHILGDRPALVDTVRNQSLLFKDIEPMAIRFASALTRRGFQKGDVFFFVTYNSALLFALQFGVQLCGGAARGYYQGAQADELEQHMNISKVRFILVEPGTAERVKMAAERLAWPVDYFSIDGAVEGAYPVEEMVREDDGTAYSGDVSINPKEDTLVIFTTSGSTGQPKGVLHTHHSMTALMAIVGGPFDFEREQLKGDTTLCILGNIGIGSYISVHNALIHGDTFVFVSKFEKSSFFSLFNQHKPKNLGLFVYAANEVCRSPEIDEIDVSFVKYILMTGSVVNTATAETVMKKFPHAKLDTAYGMTETLAVSSYHFFLPYKIRRGREKEVLQEIRKRKTRDDEYVSNGMLIPFAEAKVTDVESGNIVERGKAGKILVRGPCIMKGYVDSSAEKVSPAEIEGVILQLPAILSVCVVGVPHPTTTSAATAYVVVKQGYSVTEEEIIKHVAENLPYFKHLHGGVIFRNQLPESRGGKVDRAALLRESTRNIKK
ncbi:4-coumarate--CoA ligase 3-like isoform X2 [Ischnura elegans]|uniref:4-coumarate--CoA ligase 3-like isoform X2 n=1 Tax=Ischnura elegans TaxID=197161 RepID=UPI001ED8B1CA|nr:4-coumarate--CoA ligase 3-like isoform X2 [Ischnura elegans]